MGGTELALSSTKGVCPRVHWVLGVAEEHGRWATSFPIPSSDSLLSHVEQLLRAFILKISVCDAVLDHNPPGEMPRPLLLPW